MKVRIGVGLGVGASSDGGRFGAFVDALEGHGFDSLWLSERIAGEAPDPVVGLAFAGGRTRKLKLGTSVQVLPGRNPALLAKEWATLDRMSGGRALPAFGLGNPIAAEHQAFGVEREARASIFDEVLPLMRRLWAEDDVDHDGEHFTYKQLTVRPKPLQEQMDVWLGGRAKSELRRCGRLGDGWLASFLTADECAERRLVIEEAAAATDRTVDPEHYGAMVLHARDCVPDGVLERLAALRPGSDPGRLVAVGPDMLRQRLHEYIAVDFSKLVVVPLDEPGGASDATWDAAVGTIADAVLDLQS